MPVRLTGIFEDKKMMNYMPRVAPDGITLLCEWDNCPEPPARYNAKFCIEHSNVKLRRAADSSLRVNGQVRTTVRNRFIGVDGEGTGDGKNHKYVLLGVGQDQREWPDGVTDITEIFGFLYDHYLENRDAVYAGFFLGYDFNMWLRLLPRERAWRLISPAGIKSRARKVNPRLGPFPVEYQGWEFDMLPGMRRLKLRRAGDKGWMFICDAGPFFQASLLSVLNPSKWAEPIVTAEEYATLTRGKEHRSSACLDDDMRMYNRLENEVFSRLMSSLQSGLHHAGVNLKRQQWFGPGQAAQGWMRRVGTLESSQNALREYKPDLLEAAKATYYGGWFELTAHGHIPGITYEYDINSAYPAAASTLPCLCGTWTHKQGPPPRGHTRLVMGRIHVWGRNQHLGPLPYRTEDGNILRPRQTRGWYWKHEIDAAKRAGLISDITWQEHWSYNGCKHEAPLRQLAGLYESRLRIGKNSPEGKAFKLVYNSIYGKFAQSVGDPAYGNPFYASLITAGCRTAILDAIATHPDRSAAVVMVATDGVYFTSPHPVLDDKLSDRMGEWSREEHRNLTVFKPGVYWDDTARDAIAAGEAPQFKARGISARDFAKSIAQIDHDFAIWGKNWLPGMPPAKEDWPRVEFRSRFAQVSIRQALQWTDRKEAEAQERKYHEYAGLVQNGKKLVQDSWPGIKRNPETLREDKSMWRSQPWDGGPHWPESKPYDGTFGISDDADFRDFMAPDLPALLAFREALGVNR